MQGCAAAGERTRPSGSKGDRSCCRDGWGDGGGRDALNWDRWGAGGCPSTGRQPRGSFAGVRVSQRLCLLPFPLQAPSEYETSPDQLFYRIAHLSRGQQYLLWVAAVTSAGRGNISEKVTIEPAGKGAVGPGWQGDTHGGSAVPCPGVAVAAPCQR